MNTPRSFRKRPVEITAIQLTRENVADVEAFINGRAQDAKLPGPGRGVTEGVVIHTLEGDMRASWGDWIIRGVQGEFYPCKPDIFEQTYEHVDPAWRHTAEVLADPGLAAILAADTDGDFGAVPAPGAPREAH